MACYTVCATSSRAGVAPAYVPESSDRSETSLGPSWSAGPWVAGPPTSRAALNSLRDQLLGHYRLIERIGRGRQADVWRALRTEPFVEEVALKVLPASARDPRRRAQLRHEAERGARLVGPSLLTTFEFGEARGAAFMAMPLVIGQTLADVISQRRAWLDEGLATPTAHRLATAAEPLYLRDVVTLMIQIARAAAGAHAARVAHRDIKPGNILVCLDHDDGVFLCDFGLARDLDIATPRQLRDGAGSPLYMAPERLLKRPADEILSDVFALGVTLFEALTLEPPVVVPEDLPRALWAPFLAGASPRRPSALRPTIPGGLESTILRALSHDPGRRHPTAHHFADDLERLLHEPYARPGARSHRFGPMSRAAKTRRTSAVAAGR